MKFFDRFGLGDAARFSDPGAEIYAQFGLATMGFGALFSVDLMMAGVRALKKGHRQKAMQGNSQVMPGWFLIKDGMVIKKFIHRHAGEERSVLEFIGGAA